MLPTLEDYASRNDVGLYSRAVKARDWTILRESEPKDYYLATDPVRCYHTSTYKRYGTDDTFPNKTTYRELCSDRLNAPQWKRPQRFLSFEYFMDPKHLKEIPPSKTEIMKAQKIIPKSTYRTDYDKNFDHVELTEKQLDESVGRRRMLSQFTDHGTARRWGRNTWADESGVYANTHIRRQLDITRNHFCDASSSKKS
ncbi:unnamed protein product [Calicophoron daubneyi]|uniref:Uncharacterized protein n=1 Tax=Calicophoron daubneyi TaxID=300641 RepID=A0AAV2U010_CALDB